MSTPQPISVSFVSWFVSHDMMISSDVDMETNCAVGTENWPCNHLARLTRLCVSLSVIKLSRVEMCVSCRLGGATATKPWPTDIWYCLPLYNNIGTWTQVAASGFTARTGVLSAVILQHSV